MSISNWNKSMVAALLLLAAGFVSLGILNGQNATGQDQLQENRPAAEEVVLSTEIVAENFTAPAGEMARGEDGDGDAFFMEYRLNRDRRRAQEIELLQSMLNSADLASEVRQEVQYKLLEITSAINQELALEALIMAKGYADAVAVVQPEHVTVVVRAADFSEEDAAKIADLVTKTTGIPLSKVTVFAKK